MLELSWLRYSPETEGGYCLPCSLFSHCVPNHSALNLISQPVLPGKNAITKFKNHESKLKGIHSACQDAYHTFLRHYRSKELDVSNQIAKLSEEKTLENRRVLRSIIDTIMLCGRMGIPLCGHRDDSKFFPKAGEYSVEPGLGNFIELINFGIRRGDDALKKHYTNCQKNATYLSKTTQNNLISCCADVIIDDIINEVKSAKFFSVIADEAMDVSGNEQLAFVQRYVDLKNAIRGDFVGFMHLEWKL